MTVGLQGLIARERSHLVYVQSFCEGSDPISLTAADFEGLVSVFCLVLQGEAPTPEPIVNGISNLYTPEMALQRKPKLLADILARCDQTADREMIGRFIERGPRTLSVGW